MKLSHPFFASSDRNLLEQITYITLVSLYPGDIPNYRGMTVGTAITSSFEDSLETLWQEHRTWPYFSPSQGVRSSYFRAGRAVIIITNNRKNLGMFANTSIARSTPLSTGAISPREKLVKSFTAFRDTENLGRFSVFRRFFAGNSSVKSKMQWPIALLFSDYNTLTRVIILNR